MTYTSDKVTGPVARRARRRRRQKVRQIRPRRSAKRVLREQEAANVEECFDLCSDRGFHCDPDINIGSEIDPSRNQFSILESRWSSTTSQTITSPQSNFTFTLANPCNLSAQNSSTSLLLPSVPTTPPSRPIVKLPDTAFNREPTVFHRGPELYYTSNNDTSKSPRNPFNLPPIPSPFLYHSKSRELLQGLDESDPHPAKSFAIAYGQETPDPDFKSYRVDVLPLNFGGRQARTEEVSQPILNNEPSFVGAALPDMSKAVPARASTIVRPDADFYKHTRSYLRPSKNAAERPNIASVPTPSNAGGTTSQPDESRLPILTTINTFPRWLRKMTHVFPGPCSGAPPLPPPSTTSLDPDPSWDKPGLWEPIASLRVQQQTSMHDFIFPKLTPAAVCRNPPSSWCKNTTDGYVRRTTNFWDSSCGGYPRKTEMNPRNMFATPSSNATVFDANSALSAFEETMSKKPKDQGDMTASTGLWIQPNSPHATDSTWALPTTMTSRAPRFKPHHRRTSRIRDAAIQSAGNPSTLSEPNNTIDIAACPSSVCADLVPARLYEHQYLGWLSRRAGKDTVYRDQTWLTIGASIAHLQKDLAGKGPEVEMGMRKDAEPSTGIEKVVEHIADEDFQYADAWWGTPVTKSNLSESESDYGLRDLFKEKKELRGIEDSAKNYFAHGVIGGDDVPVPFFDKVVKTPDSEVGWTDIGTEIESESDWDWSEDDLGA